MQILALWVAFLPSSTFNATLKLILARFCHSISDDLFVFVNIIR